MGIRALQCFKNIDKMMKAKAILYLKMAVILISNSSKLIIPIIFAV